MLKEQGRGWCIVNASQLNWRLVKGEKGVDMM